LFPKLVQIEILFFGLGQHVGLFLTNVVPDAFCHDGELRRIAVAKAGVIDSHGQGNTTRIFAIWTFSALEINFCRLLSAGDLDREYGATHSAGRNK
jgi:hypothetical protein